MVNIILPACLLGGLVGFRFGFVCLFAACFFQPRTDCKRSEDPLKKNSGGQTPLEYAQSKQRRPFCDRCHRATGRVPVAFLIRFESKQNRTFSLCKGLSLNLHCKSETLQTDIDDNIPDFMLVPKKRLSSLAADGPKCNLLTFELELPRCTDCTRAGQAPEHCKPIGLIGGKRIPNDATVSACKKAGV